MEPDETAGPVDAGGVATVDRSAPAPGSIAAQLVARRQALAESRAPERTLAVPGYDDRLRVRYRYPEAGYKAIVKAIERAQASKDKDAELWGNADLLISCCSTVLGADAQGRSVDLRTDQPVADDEPPESPLRFGKALAGVLQIELPGDIKSPARYVIRSVFSPRAVADGVFSGDFALMHQGGEVLAWLRDQESEINEEFVGE